MEKLSPLSKVINPNSASTHFLSEYDWTAGSDVDISDLEPFLQSNVFKLDPGILKSVIGVAEGVRNELSNCLEQYSSEHDLLGQIDALLLLSQITLRENTILGTCVFLKDSSIKLKRALRCISFEPQDIQLVAKCHPLVRHLVEQFGKAPQKTH